MATISEIAGLLRDTPVFSGVGEQERLLIARQMNEVRLEPGQVLFVRGDASRSIYLVTEGSIRLSVVTADGRELSYLHAERGELIGEIAAIDGGERTTDAKAVSPVKLMQLDAATLLRHLGSNAAFALACCRFLCQRLRTTNATLESVALHSIEVRVARYLLSQVRKNGVEPASRIRLSGLLTQAELALLIGASRPRVNSAFQSLEDMGAIERSRKGKWCNLAELESIAQMC